MSISCGTRPRDHHSLAHNLPIGISYSYSIMLTCPCNVDPLAPHLYMVKLGFTGEYIIFALKHGLWVHVRTASHEAVLTCTHNLCFEQK